MAKIPVYELRKVQMVTPLAADGTVANLQASTSTQAAAMLEALVNGSGVEEVWVLALNARRFVVASQMVSRGSLTQSLCHPREVFRAAIQMGAAAVVVGHNHPGGDPAPSADDDRLTRQLRQAGELLGIPVLDHVIIGEHSHFSYASAGWKS